ncbi:MAG: hypothetical protein MJE66_19970 [Proteobacteria bacterium]|nr:hypothetical protein [Pseudomonadota bacterium]
MRAFHDATKRLLCGPILWAAFGLASSAGADDTVLFSTAVPPNVVILVDTSGSMVEQVFHPEFDESETTCSYFRDQGGYRWEQYDEETTETIPDPVPTGCVKTRTIPFETTNDTILEWEHKYLDWYFSPAADSHVNSIRTDRAVLPCLNESYLNYGRTKITAARHILREVICRVNQTGDVRFGLGRFRGTKGGYVTVEAKSYDDDHDDDLEAAIRNLEAKGGTPLAESLFQHYSYFMSRRSADLPEGADDDETFPIYDYTLGGSHDDPSDTDDPVTAACQKQFLILITDGEPSSDDFSNNEPGYDDIDELIGNFDSGDGDLAIDSYLNDIAKFMHERDFRPDLDGSQTIDVYTVGFTTSGDANELLKRTAEVGGGEFYTSDSPEELARAISDALASIIQKTQAFTAATVPASRTTDGNNIYMSFFLPNSGPFWEGHISNFTFTGAGEIRDRDGDCAVIDPGGGTSCGSGVLDPDADPWWDAADGIPQPPGRTLYMSDSGTSAGSLHELFTVGNVTAADLGVVDADVSLYPGTQATEAEGLADEIVSYVRGCPFGEVSCTTGRDVRLGDVFHSNPIVVGPPNAARSEPSYREYAREYGTRKRVLYAGANDGFLHGFNAGVHVTTPTTGYNQGDGVELFGFMPWQVRNNIRRLPIDTEPRDTYYVDGSAQAADVWFYSGALDADKTWQEWRTILVGGLREGGSQYYALDVTNPDGRNSGVPAYPAALWEFPCEANTAVCNAARAHMGQTWGEAVITRVRVEVTGNDNGGRGFERYVAVVTGGYDVTGDPNHASYDANATAGRGIFLLDVKTGEILAEKKFNSSAPSTNPESQMSYAIASRPAVFDLDFDGFADVIYVGDLGGQVFKWVVEDIGGDPVNGAGSDDTTDQPNWPFKLFFQHPSYTSGGTTHYQSFFNPPTGILKHGDLWLALGAGERNNLLAEGISGDAGDNNRYFVLIDRTPFTVPSGTAPQIALADLVDITNSASCFDSTNNEGYYLVGADGEKFITASGILLGDLFTGSFIPTSGGDRCSESGQAFLYRFNLQCGEGSFAVGEADGTTPEESRHKAIGAGLPTPPRFSVGPPQDTPGPCGNRVLILTSNGVVDNSCGADFGGAGVKLRSWRQR